MRMRVPTSGVGVVPAVCVVALYALLCAAGGIWFEYHSAQPNLTSVQLHQAQQTDAPVQFARVATVGQPLAFADYTRPADSLSTEHSELPQPNGAGLAYDADKLYALPTSFQPQVLSHFDNFAADSKFSDTVRLTSEPVSIAEVHVDVPAVGHVVVIVTADVQAYHDGSSQVVVEYDISTTDNSFSETMQSWTLSDEATRGFYRPRLKQTQVFTDVVPGGHTFHVVGRQSDGTHPVILHDLTITALQFPLDR